MKTVVIHHHFGCSSQWQAFRASPHALLAHLDRDFRVGHHVLIPIRFFSITGSHNIDALVFIVMHYFQDVLAYEAGFSPDVIEQQ